MLVFWQIIGQKKAEPQILLWFKMWPGSFPSLGPDHHLQYFLVTSCKIYKKRFLFTAFHLPIHLATPLYFPHLPPDPAFFAFSLFLASQLRSSLTCVPPLPRSTGHYPESGGEEGGYNYCKSPMAAVQQDCLTVSPPRVEKRRTGSSHRRGRGWLGKEGKIWANPRRLLRFGPIQPFRVSRGEKAGIEEWIGWLKRSKEKILFQIGSQNGVLSISAISPEDYGIYQCEVSNEAGRQMEIITLLEGKDDGSPILGKSETKIS